MNKRERILERRKIFKQELLRPLAALMYYKINLRAKMIEEDKPILGKENNLLEKLSTLAENYHEFLQSHDFTHHENVAYELQGKLIEIQAVVRELGRYYEIQQDRPALFETLPQAINKMRKIITDFDAFEKRNEKYRDK